MSLLLSYNATAGVVFGGVSAVISEDCGDEYFREVMTSFLGLPNSQSIEKLYAVAEH